MNTYPLKKLTSLLFIAVLLFSFRPVQTDFSGAWKLNESKSELGQFGARGVASKIMIEQKTDVVSLAKTATNFQGEEAITTEVLSFDGKEAETFVFGTAKRKAKLKWSSDEQNMLVSATIAFERQGQTFDISITETWSLSADRKTLTVASNMTTPQGEISTKAVYDK